MITGNSVPFGAVDDSVGEDSAAVVTRLTLPHGGVVAGVHSCQVPEYVVIRTQMGQVTRHVEG